MGSMGSMTLGEGESMGPWPLAAPGGLDGWWLVRRAGARVCYACVVGVTTRRARRDRLSRAVSLRLESLVYGRRRRGEIFPQKRPFSTKLPQMWVYGVYGVYDPLRGGSMGL